MNEMSCFKIYVFLLVNNFQCVTGTPCTGVKRAELRTTGAKPPFPDLISCHVQEYLRSSFTLLRVLIRSVEKFAPPSVSTSGKSL
jgi:hypothetical protein